jgi:hypothetical protein
MAWVVGIGVFLALLFGFPKQVGILMAALVAVGGILFAYVSYTDNKASEEFRKKQQAVSMWAFYNEEKCSKDFPILVRINNGYTKTLLEVSFSLSGYREGYSRPVYEAGYLVSDRIVAPQQMQETCWSLPRLNTGEVGSSPSELNWRINVSYPKYEDSTY